MRPALISEKNARRPQKRYVCRCWLEEITAKEAGRESEKVQEPTPPEDVTIDSASGFSFNPEHAFETFDLSKAKSRELIIAKVEKAVVNKQLGPVGMIVAPPVKGLPMEKIPGEKQVKRAFGLMETAARRELESVGVDPDHLPDYEEINRIFNQKNRVGKNIPKSVLEKFPKEPFEVTRLNNRAIESVGLPMDVPVILGRGNQHHGIEHLWRNHKDLFVNPGDAIKLLQETIGNPNCRVVVSMKRAVSNSKPICLRRIILHNPETKTYCVMIYNENEKNLRLVSWNNAEENYGNNEWSLR